MSEFILVPKKLLDAATLEKVEQFDILPKIKARMSSLDNYLNSKELNVLQSYIGDIEAGESSVLYMVAFLEIVPEGSFDSDRGLWNNLVQQRHTELEEQL